jgi:hypothetical protein
MTFVFFGKQTFQPAHSKGPPKDYKKTRKKKNKKKKKKKKNKEEQKKPNLQCFVLF